MKCPNCEIDLPQAGAGALRSCPYCGAELAAPAKTVSASTGSGAFFQPAGQRTCPKCSSLVPEDNAFCPHCGNRMDDDSARPAQSPERYPGDVEKPVRQSPRNAIVVPRGAIEHYNAQGTVSSGSYESVANPQSALHPVKQAGPWRRYFARMMDIMLCETILSFVFGIFVAVTESFSLLEVPSIVLGIICLPFSLLLEGAAYGMFGGTLGKWLFSERVLDRSGRKISGGEYLARSFQCYASGLGLGIPIVSLFTLINQNSRLGKGMAASYDEGTGRVVTAGPIGAKWLLIVPLYIGLSALLCG